jgi:hypothetical protein
MVEALNVVLAIVAALRWGFGVREAGGKVKPERVAPAGATVHADSGRHRSQVSPRGGGRWDCTGEATAVANLAGRAAPRSGGRSLEHSREHVILSSRDVATRSREMHPPQSADGLDADRSTWIA